MNEFTETLERMRRTQQERLAIIATLPCASCDIDSPAAQACKFYDRMGCKHMEPLEARRLHEERVQNRLANLVRAGFDEDAIKSDEKIRMVLQDAVEPWKAIHAVRRALASKTLRFLVLGGDHRTGKTLALVYACAVRSKAVYIRAQQLGRPSQNSERWIDTELLCVNELGREHLGNGFTASNLDEIMAEREYGRKLTIFATNLPLRKRNADDSSELPALADRYGDLFVSRISNGIGAYVNCEAGAVDVAPMPTRNPTPFSEMGER